MRLSILLTCVVLTGGHCMGALASPAGHEQAVLSVQYRYDPCTDGRVSDGRPRTCAELRRALRHDRRYPRSDDEYERRGNPRINPCTDGRFSDGRARNCRELLEWLDTQ